MDFTDAAARRQTRYRKRARRAKWAARLLMPVCAMAVSAAIWSEPRLASELQRGLAEVAPLLAAKASGTPAPASDQTAANSADIVTGLPASKIPVRRAAVIATD